MCSPCTRRLTPRAILRAKSITDAPAGFLCLAPTASLQAMQARLVVRERLRPTRGIPFAPVMIPAVRKQRLRAVSYAADNRIATTDEDFYGILGVGERFHQDLAALSQS